MNIASITKHADTDGGAAGAGNGRDTKKFWMYLGCALFGGFVGALCVAFAVQQTNSQRLSQAHEAINDRRGPQYT